MKALQRSPVRVRSSTLVSPVQASHLPQGFVYAVIVGGVAAWSWDRWQSAHSTALAALSASACMILLEIVLSAASPWAARAIFGLRGGVHNPLSAAQTGVGEPTRDGELSAVAQPAVMSREAVDRTLRDAEARLHEAAARLEKAQQHIDELELDRDFEDLAAGRPLKPARASRAAADLEQPIDSSGLEAAAVDLEGVRHDPAEAPENTDSLYSETPSSAAPSDAQLPVRSNRVRVSVANVVFVILSAFATLMFSLFVLLLFTA